MNFCGKCGNQLPENSRFCSKCGNAIIPLQQPVQPSSPQYSAPRLQEKTKFDFAEWMKENKTGIYTIIVIAVIYTILIIADIAMDWSKKPSAEQFTQNTATSSYSSGKSTGEPYIYSEAEILELFKGNWRDSDDGSVFEISDGFFAGWRYRVNRIEQVGSGLKATFYLYCDISTSEGTDPQYEPFIAKISIFRGTFLNTFDVNPDGSFDENKPTISAMK